MRSVVEESAYISTIHGVGHGTCHARSLASRVTPLLVELLVMAKTSASANEISSSQYATRRKELLSLVKQLRSIGYDTVRLVAFQAVDHIQGSSRPRSTPDHSYWKPECRCAKFLWAHNCTMKSYPLLWI